MMQSKARCLLLVIVVVVAIFGSPLTGVTADAAWNGVPLPKDLRVVAADPDVPKEFAAYSGRWQGWWGDNKQLPGILVIEEIHAGTPEFHGAPEAIVVYAWGTSREVKKAGWLRRSGHFWGDRLYLGLGPAILVTYKMNPDGTLDGTDDNRGQVTRGTFQFQRP